MALHPNFPESPYAILEAAAWSGLERVDLPLHEPI